MAFLNGLLTGLLAGGEQDPDLDQALERAAYRVEPSLKRSRSWPKLYRRPIRAALAQARRVAAAIPGPVTVDAQAYIHDPFVHALFASPEDIRRALCSSQVMREYIASCSTDEAYALLSMRRMDKHSLGMEDSGGVMRRDVPQHMIWFSDHQLLGPEPTLAAARETLLWTIFDRFLERVAVGIGRIRAERERLTLEKDLAQARLRAAPLERRPELRQALEKSLNDLSAANRCLENGNMAEVFGTVLSHPEDCLYLSEHSWRLDNMGLVRPEADEQNGNRLTFVELRERYVEARTVVLVHCHDIHPMSQSERLLEAERWLG